MLDAFGKGASDDIQAAKSELYSQVVGPSSQGRPSLCPHIGTRVRVATLWSAERTVVSRVTGRGCIVLLNVRARAAQHSLCLDAL
jgi:hypothetical protein